MAETESLLSVLIPAYNEATTISEVLRKVLDLGPVLKEVIVVNDGSSDKTGEVVAAVAADDDRVRLLELGSNQGKTAAIRHALAHATGEILIIQDADLEYDPAEIPVVIDPILKGQADVVYGSRMLVRRTSRVLYYYHFLANRFLTCLSNLLTNRNMTDIETCYKAFRAGVIKPLNLSSSGFGMEAEITAMVCKTRVRTYEVPISYYGRTYAEGKKISGWDGLMAIFYILYYNLFAPLTADGRAYIANVNAFLDGRASGEGTKGVAKRSEDSEPAQSVGPLRAKRTILYLLVLLLSFAFLAAMRWTSQMPYSNDSAENLLVSRTFLRTGQFTVDAMHGTKYPPAIATIAAGAAALRAEPARAVLMANYASVLGITLVIFWLASRLYSPGLGVLAGLYCLVNPIAWQSANKAIADVLFMLITAVILWMALRTVKWGWGEVILGLGLLLCATATRSVGIVLCVPLTASLLYENRAGLDISTFVKAGMLVTVSVVVLALWMVYQGQFGSHPTGYMETFFLRNPYDASLGRLTWSSLALRTIGNAWHTVKDVKNVLGGPSLGSVFAAAGAIVFLVFACMRSTKQAFVVGTSISVFSAVMVAWPYHGARFALPLLPIGALGLAAIGRAVLCERKTGVVVVFGLLVVAFMLSGVHYVYLDAVAERKHRGLVSESLNELARWCKGQFQNGDMIASFDYRELALRLDRPVVPLRYTSNLAAHVRVLESHHVDWFVVSGAMSALREPYARAVAKHLGDRADLRFDNGTFRIYRLRLPIVASRLSPAQPTDKSNGQVGSVPLNTPSQAP